MADDLNDVRRELEADPIIGRRLFEASGVSIKGWPPTDEEILQLVEKTSADVQEAKRRIIESN